MSPDCRVRQPSRQGSCPLPMGTAGAFATPNRASTLSETPGSSTPGSDITTTIFGKVRCALRRLKTNSGLRTRFRLRRGSARAEDANQICTVDGNPIMERYDEYSKGHVGRRKRNKESGQVPAKKKCYR